MAKKAAKKLKSLTVQGDDLEIVIHALELLEDMSEDMVNDSGLTMEERGIAAFDSQHCRNLLDRIKGPREVR